MNPFRKLKEVAVSKLLALMIRKLAEGDFGAGPARAYWWLAGVKTYTAIGLAAIAGGLRLAYEMGICEPCYDYVTGLIAVAGALAMVGLFDAAVRIEPPSRPRDTVRKRGTGSGW